MSIILEGCDGSGKTTLARQLCRLEPSAEYYHSGGAPSSLEAENEFLAVQAEIACQRHKIIDRATCISQQVYANRLHEPKLAHALELLLDTPDVILVYCRPPTDHLMSPEKLNWRDVETEEYKQHIIQQQHIFIQRYDALMANLPHITFDFTSPESLTLTMSLSCALRSQPAVRQLREIIKSSRVVR